MNSVEIYRTNYFRVKDLSAFKAWVGRFSTDETLIVHRDEDAGLVAIQDDSGEGIPTTYCDEAWTDEGDDLEEFDFLGELGMHLQPGQVAIVMSSCHQGMRYVGGWAGAINADGESVGIALDDIHQLAEKLGDAETRCEW